MHVLHALVGVNVHRTAVVVGHGAEQVTKYVQENAPAWANVAFAEQARAHHRAYQNTDLARRRDVAHRREAHRREHQNIRQRDQDGTGDRLVFVLMPFRHRLV